MRALSYQEARSYLAMVEGGIPTFYVDNVVVPTLMSIPAVEQGDKQ